MICGGKTKQWINWDMSWQKTSPSRDTPSTPRFPTISDYNGSERNADDHDILETNLEVSTLLLS